MQEERLKPEQRKQLEDLGITVPSEAAIPPEVESFLREVEKEPEPMAREQPAASLPSAPPAPVADSAPTIKVTPRRLHQLLTHHAGNAARWLGEQIKRILKMRLRRGEISSDAI